MPVPDPPSCWRCSGSPATQPTCWRENPWRWEHKCPDKKEGMRPSATQRWEPVDAQGYAGRERGS